MYQTLFKITRRYKTINKNSLSRWSVTLLKFLRKFGACQKLEPAGRIGDFGGRVEKTDPHSADYPLTPLRGLLYGLVRGLPCGLP